VATRETWSNVTVSWPIRGDARVNVELSGLPAFDRDRNFIGYRGLGVCRDMDRLDGLPPAPMTSAVNAHPETGRQRPGPQSVTPFHRSAAGAVPGGEAAPQSLTTGEHDAFHDLGRQLTARLAASDNSGKLPDEPQAPRTEAAAATLSASGRPASAPSAEGGVPDETPDRGLLSRLPIGILIYRFEELLFVNRAFLATTGYADLARLREAGGLDALFVEASASASENEGRPMTFAVRGGQSRIGAQLLGVTWKGEPAFAVVLTSGGQSVPATGEGGQRPPAEALARLAEEARSPLDLIDRSCDVMLDGRLPPLGEERLGCIEDMRKAAAQLRALLDPCTRRFGAPCSGEPAIQ
jgi:hypothetical protein